MIRTTEGAPRDEDDDDDADDFISLESRGGRDHHHPILKSLAADFEHTRTSRTTPIALCV